VAEALCRNSGPERTAAFCYAVGWTQHTTGVQCIRAAAIIQLLLGNIGRPGGGIMALRGHASIQGSTDIPTLYNLLPGYLPLPKAKHDSDLKTYNEAYTSPSGWWGEFPKYSVSLLKAWYGDAATAANEFCFHYLPVLTGDHSHLNTVADMADGKVKGYFVMGENPVVGTVNGALHREGLRALEWLVVRDFQLTETAEFWRFAPEIERGDVRTEDIGTEVFFFPAAAHTEKEGSFTNTQRLLQWHHKAIDPPGDCRSELDFVFKLGQRLKTLYEGSEDPKDRPVLDLTWDYPAVGPRREPDAQAVLREINGYTVADEKPVDGFTALLDDGSTACGCWIYSGCFKDGVNQTARRKPHWEQSWVAPEWAWAWPHNRRMLYNRASSDPSGKPWSERKAYVWWDEAQQKWTGHDDPDFVEKPPSYRPPDDARGKDTIGGADPFVMQADGKGWLYVPGGLKDGPLPAHYEHQESLIENPLYGQQCNPARMEWLREKDNPYHQPYDDPRFPYLLTTYRLTEHHTAGGMSRWLTWLSELQPEAFCEVSPELAEEVGLKNGGWATLRSARAEIETRVLVTDRMRPLHLNGRTVHQIGMPYHWSSKGLVRGDCPNELFPFVADPNASIMETKGISVMIEAGRRGRRRRYVTSGPLTPNVPGKEDLRDLPAVRHRRGSGHGFKVDHGKEGHV
jgi:formate dehydrogenase major subunit